MITSLFLWMVENSSTKVVQFWFVGRFFVISWKEIFTVKAALDCFKDAKLFDVSKHWTILCESYSYALKMYKKNSCRFRLRIRLAQFLQSSFTLECHQRMLRIWDVKNETDWSDCVRMHGLTSKLNFRLLINGKFDLNPKFLRKWFVAP